MSSKRGMTGDELSAIYRNIDRASRDRPRPVPPAPVPVTPSAPPASDFGHIVNPPPPLASSHGASNGDRPTSPTPAPLSCSSQSSGSSTTSRPARASTEDVFTIYRQMDRANRDRPRPASHVHGNSGLVDRTITSTRNNFREGNGGLLDRSSTSTRNNFRGGTNNSDRSTSPAPSSLSSSSLSSGRSTTTPATTASTPARPSTQDVFTIYRQIDRANRDRPQPAHHINGNRGGVDRTSTSTRNNFREAGVSPAPSSLSCSSLSSGTNTTTPATTASSPARASTEDVFAIYRQMDRENRDRPRPVPHVHDMRSSFLRNNVPSRTSSGPGRPTASSTVVSTDRSRTHPGDLAGTNRDGGILRTTTRDSDVVTSNRALGTGGQSASPTRRAADDGDIYASASSQRNRRQRGDVFAIYRDMDRANRDRPRLTPQHTGTATGSGGNPSGGTSRLGGAARTPQSVSGAPPSYDDVMTNTELYTVTSTSMPDQEETDLPSYSEFLRKEFG